MVTHDIDEALYLADRLLLMTDGPEARIGEVLEMPFGLAGLAAAWTFSNIRTTTPAAGVSSTSWRITPTGLPVSARRTGGFRGCLPVQSRPQVPALRHTARRNQSTAPDEGESDTAFALPKNPSLC
ncbi:MAG: hypothetical protein DMG13_07290 [Acidobacteria bacterium]|nr:MAG: hypothetical protein DMG13_07290 [Acidobacteriota bacterium]